MLDRKQIREAIACPQLGDTTYGKWGILTVEQRLTIARLLDELEHTDDYLKRLWLKNQKQKEVIDRILSETKETRDIIINNRCDNILTHGSLINYLGIVEDLLEEVE